MNAERVAIFIDGGRTILCLVIALYFVKLGRSSRDRLYHGFAAAFALLATGSLMIGLKAAPGDYDVVVVVPRLLAFLIIIASIIDKNRRGAIGRSGS
jgi:hypothetical protein